MARIYDNIDIKFEQALRDIMESPSVKRVDFCVGYFNLRGWKLVVNQVNNLPGDYVDEQGDNVLRTCRLLIGMHSHHEDYIRQIYGRGDVLPDANMVQRCKLQIAVDFRKQLLIGLPTKQDEWTLRRLSAQLKEGKVTVKLYLREPLHAKLYIAHKDDYSCPRVCVMGSSNLTYSGLTRQGELNAEFANEDETSKFYSWFQDRWEDRYCIDISKELIDVIDNSWASEQDIPPYYIYLKIAYHLSEEARNGIKEFSLTPEFRKELFDFQQNAVKIAARHLNNDKRGGAMIGDVVGLGKTITACAIAKIYEMTFASSTLIICPANLQDMWRKYVSKYDLKADIMSMSKSVDVESSRYYRLIIVDESHNLRNGGKRYQDIKTLIEHLNSKVLLLTATPYNKDFSDLSNQLRLFLSDDQDLGIRPETYIRSLGGERAFLQQHSDIFIRSIKAFEKSPYPEDWNELMKLFLVRRTRSFIKQYFAKEDPTNHRRYLEFPDKTRSYFPDRLPKAIRFKTTHGDQYSRLYSEEMIALMRSLQLPRYGLSKYISETKILDAPRYEQQLIENLSRAGQRMMGFCMSTFFKRIDSSGFSFLLTLYRHIVRNCVFIYALENKLPLPIGDENNLPEDYIEDEDVSTTVFGEELEGRATIDSTLQIYTDLSKYMEEAKKHYDIISNKNNVAWLPFHYFKKTLKQQLKKDCATLIQMIELCGDWQQHTDEKLNELQKLIEVEHKEDKIIVFTQYSDTARYIYNQLRKRGILAIDYATGDSHNPTAIVERFSPISNGNSTLALEEQTRVLIATDVLSEGQNLQDAHVIVNFDLPWAIIRLIQRAGRVDRIGQTSNLIYCYSFFPAEGVEEIIKLRSRLNERINENANIVGSDEVFFEGNEQNLRDMFNEKSGVLDEDDDAEVDLSSQAYQIWKSATDARPELKQIIPNLQNMIYATRTADEALQEGVITYARTTNDFDILTWLNRDGEFITQSQKRILDALRCSADTPAIPAMEQHHELVGKAVEMMKTQSQNVSGGILGNRFSTRYKIIALLEHYYEQPATIFFSEESKEQLKQAIDDIYNYPLLEQSKFMLGRMMRATGKTTNDEIIEYVLEMRRTGALCRIEEVTNQNKENTIICSMGLTLKTEQ